MDPAKRIIINTGLQYVKAVITTVFSLFATRLILEALQVSDYGIYTLIAGIVAMLGFMTNALIITTQRFLSLHLSNKPVEELRRIFVNSLLLHLFFGLIIVLFLMALRGILFDSVLNIDIHRIDVAKTVYSLTVLMLMLTIATAPFKALFIAHEQMSFIVAVEIIDAVVKFAIASIMAFVTADRLLVYVWLLALILFLNLLAFSLYGLMQFRECCLLIRKRDLDWTCMRQMLGFAGWTTYGMGCVAARNQGTMVVLNHFFGTVVNAAYGLAFQINGAISFLVGSIINAMNPQLMQSEGDGNRPRMLSMAAHQSKYSVAILAICLIPVMVEMPTILFLWLKDVPDYTTMFCRFILLAFLCDQLTLGLSSANQAMGNIKAFTLLTYTPKLLFLCLSWWMFEAGSSIEIMMVWYVLIELGVALIRIPYMKMKAGLDVWHYICHVILPSISFAVVIFVACWLITISLTLPYRFLITITVAVVVGIVAGWFMILGSSEKRFVIDTILQRMKR